ncbi:MAG TPA: hypothetical protein PKY82_03735 [Pyrinomonadaceae bacterium]|nr:hypothetical protein [Pyrinomonadaceae bacterium]
MKIAFFSESVADESALKILVSGILEEEIEDTNLPNNLIYRSCTHLDRDLPAVISAVYYNSNAEALVVASDSDDTPVHINEHENKENEKCRLCKLRKTIEKSLSKLQAFEGKDLLKVAIGVPVPAIEAWYLFGINPQVSSNYWFRFQNGEKIRYDRKKLKEQVYGTTRPSLELETKRAVEETIRIVENELLEGLEINFPQGFGKMADEIRLWKNEE